jgi:hypothetical protein
MKGIQLDIPSRFSRELKLHSPSLGQLDSIPLLCSYTAKTSDQRSHACISRRSKGGYRANSS